MNEILKQIMILLSVLTSFLGIKEEKFGAIEALPLSSSIIINEKKYTQTEYNNLKIDVIDKVRKNMLTYEEKKDWIDILDRECRGIILDNVTSADNLKIQLNDQLEKGC